MTETQHGHGHGHAAQAENAAPARDAHADITATSARLAEIKVRLRGAILSYARRHGYEHTEQVRSLLGSLHLPGSNVSDEQAEQQAQQESAWKDDPSDYSEAGMLKQAERMRQTLTDYCRMVAEVLNGLTRNRTISREQANETLQRAGITDADIPPEPKVTVSFTAVSTVSAPVSGLNGYTDAQIEAEARSRVTRALQGVQYQGFEQEGDGPQVQVTVTRS